MTSAKYIVHKNSHTLHLNGGCGHATGYSKEKYDEYQTLERAITEHSPDIRSCKTCVRKGYIKELTPKV